MEMLKTSNKNIYMAVTRLKTIFNNSWRKQKKLVFQVK